MELSECCDARRWNDETDICSECKEHADFYDTEEVLIVEAPVNTESVTIVGGESVVLKMRK